ncbi:MAG TPA: hypothetical protein VFA67_16165 [Candidatus Sulfotelmatobacter sp.]|nr:hypothetical protein [Candidatus Sulfotelmatobacter sp.]
MPTTTTTEAPICYPNQHMSLQDYALYEVAMRLTCGGAKPLIFDGRKLAQRFRKASKSTIYRAEKSLLKAGWFKLPDDAPREKQIDPVTKRYLATTYHVLAHSEWIAKHGDSECTKCHIPVPYLGQEPAATPPPHTRSLGDPNSKAYKTRAKSQLKRFLGCVGGLHGMGSGLQSSLRPELIRSACHANDLENIAESRQYLTTIRKFVDAVLNSPVPDIPVPSTGTELEPVPSTERSCPKTEESLSQNQQIPVPPAGHSLLDSSLKALVNTSIGADAPFSLDSSEDVEEEQNLIDETRRGVWQLSDARGLRLTQEQVDEIRRLWATGNYTKSNLAGRFHTSPTTIARVLKPLKPPAFIAVPDWVPSEPWQAFYEMCMAGAGGGFPRYAVKRIVRQLAKYRRKGQDIAAILNQSTMRKCRDVLPLDPPSFAVPEWVPAKPWAGFIEMRKAQRKPLKTERAVQLIVNKLEKLRDGGGDVGAILDQSTERGWTSVFPLKQSAGAKPSRHVSFADVDYTKGADGWNMGGGQ